jgi:hypothetical protein
MRNKTETLLAVMNVLAWLTFVGLLIKAGAILISYAVSIGNPEASKNLYEGLNLSGIRQFSFWQYTGTVSLMIAIPVLESYVAFLMIKVLSKIKMVNPFKIEISRLLEKISYFILVTWFLAMIYDMHLKWLSKHVAGIEQNLISLEFIFLAAIVFVIAQIFKKGVEIQSENELTI